MEFRISDSERRINRAYLELMAIADADIESAHGVNTPRILLSPSTAALYDFVVEIAEEQARADEADF